MCRHNQVPIKGTHKKLRVILGARNFVRYVYRINQGT